MNPLSPFELYFYDNKVRINGTEFPLGYFTTEFLNYPNDKIRELDILSNQIAAVFRSDPKYEAAENLLEIQSLISNNIDEPGNDPSTLYDQVMKKLNPNYTHGLDQDNDLVLETQILELQNIFCQMNSYIVEMPFYRQLNLDRKQLDNLLFTHLKPAVPVLDIVAVYLLLVDNIICFKNYIQYFLDHYVNFLKKRDLENIAVCMSNFFTYDMGFKLNQLSLHTPSRAIFHSDHDIQVSYVTPVDAALDLEHFDPPYICEKIVFKDLMAFLQMDFFRGMMAGNVPKRCKNCSSWFLQYRGYHTEYCDRIAPDQKEKTCRQVGAANTRNQKDRTSPVWKIYRKAYSKYSQRKNRGKISQAEFAAWSGEAVRLRDLAERNELPILEFEKMLDTIKY